MGEERHRGNLKLGAFEFTLTDIIKTVFLIVSIVGMYYAMMGDIRESKKSIEAIEKMGEPPAGRLFVLEGEIKHHTEYVTEDQEARLRLLERDNTSVTTNLQHFNKRLDRQDAVLDEILKELRRKPR